MASAFEAKLAEAEATAAKQQAVDAATRTGALDAARQQQAAADQANADSAVASATARAALKQQAVDAEMRTAAIAVARSQQARADQANADAAVADATAKQKALDAEAQGAAAQEARKGLQAELEQQKRTTSELRAKVAEVEAKAAKLQERLAGTEGAAAAKDEALAEKEKALQEELQKQERLTSGLKAKLAEAEVNAAKTEQSRQRQISDVSKELATAHDSFETIIDELQVRPRVRTTS